MQVSAPQVRNTVREVASTTSEAGNISELKQIYSITSEWTVLHETERVFLQVYVQKLTFKIL